MMRPVPLGLLVAVIAIGIDQVTKWWILASVMDPPRIINVTPFFNVVLVWNRGISFGMFSNESMAGVWILSFLALIIVGFYSIGCGKRVQARSHFPWSHYWRRTWQRDRPGGPFSCLGLP